MLLGDSALFGLLAVALYRRFGRAHLAALLIFPALAPAWLLTGATWLPDLPAGLLTSLALVCAYPAARALVAERQPRLVDVAAMEVALVAALYLRGPALLLTLALHAMFVVLALAGGSGRWRRLAIVIAGLAGFAAALVPWSLAASRHFDARVVTTTNVPLVFADSFGDPARTCFGPCAKGQDIWPAWRYAQQRAARKGSNALTVERAMMAHSIAGLTPRAYLAKVRGNFGRLLFDPPGVVERQVSRMYRVPPDLRGTVLTLVGALTLTLYVPFMLALLLVNLLPLRTSASVRMQSVLLKLATACALAQPFVHKASARYWTGFAPLMAWAAALLWCAWRARGTSTVGEHSHWLDRIQLAYAAVFVTLGTAIMLA